MKLIYWPDAASVKPWERFGMPVKLSCVKYAAMGRCIQKHVMTSACTIFEKEYMK